jgi:hypothetical protein
MLKVNAKSKPVFNNEFIRRKSGGGIPALTPSWECLFQEPTQDDIAIDGSHIYYSLNDANPNVQVESYYRDLTLTKTGLGTLTSNPSFEFNTNGMGVTFPGNAWLSGDTGISIGTNDFIVEFDAMVTSDTGGQNCVFTIGNALNGWLGAFIYIAPITGITLYLCDTGYATKECGWISQVGEGTSHRYQFIVDRSNDANVKLYIDDILQTKRGGTEGNISDYVALDLTGTYLHLGERHVAVYGFNGTMSNFKLLIGSLVTTTPAFKTGLTSSVGVSVPALTRATLQTGLLKKRNPNGVYLATSLAGNPQYQNTDSTKPNAVGFLSEPAATNVALRSREFDNAAWTATNIVVTPDNVTGPDGIKLANKLVSGAANGTLLQVTGVSAISKKYTNSFWMRADAGTFTSSDVVIRVDDSVRLTEQVHGLYDADTGLEITVANANQIGTTWRRCFAYASFTNDALLGFTVIGIKMITNGLTIYADMAQCEECGDTKQPTSFIFTAAASATRNIDVLTVANTELGNVFTVITMWQPNFDDANLINNYLSLLSTNADTGLVWLAILSSTGRLRWHFFGTDLDSAGVKTWTPGDWIAVGVIIDTDTDYYAAIWDGTIEMEDTTAKGTPTYNVALYIGSRTGGSPSMGQHGVTRIYKNKALTQAEVTSEVAKMKVLMGL